MTSTPEPASPRSLPSGDNLPPVEPPSAGFIVRLFVVPALIVAIMFIVGGFVKWVIDTRSEPQEFVEALRRDTPQRWQAAETLAQMLRDPKYADLKKDRKLAADLAELLESELANGETTDEQSIRLREYLCRALGEFVVPDGVPALVDAADGQGSPESLEVRLAANGALAVLLASEAELSPSDQDAVYSTVMKTSQDPDPLLRSTAAFALAYLPRPDATERLRVLAIDASANVRYNAGTMLAMQGDEAAVEVLLEMLDPEEVAGMENETDETQIVKRRRILTNALKAAEAIAQHGSNLELGELAAALEKLAASDVDRGFQVKAGELAREIERHAAAD